VIGERLLEVLDDLVALAGGRVDRHEVVVVQVDAPGANVAEQLHGIDRREDVADRLTERIAPAVGDGPEAEGELVCRCRLVAHCCSDAARVRTLVKFDGRTRPTIIPAATPRVNGCRVTAVRRNAGVD
jgi:hypothetical protein